MEGEKKLIILERLEGNEPTHLKGMQEWLAPHTDVLIMFWWVVWVTTLLIVVFRAIKQARK